jgi:hypothetical protein
MDTNNFVFSAMVIPGQVENNTLHFSIGFELNATHDVFTASPAIDAGKWKNDILLFPKILRAAVRKNAFGLNCGDANFIPIIVKDPQNDNDAMILWSGMLGYEFSGGITPKIREKSWKGPRGPIHIGVPKVHMHLKTFIGKPSLGAANFQAQQVLNPISSIKDIMDQINGNIVLTGLKSTTLDQDTYQGIGRAHQAAQTASQARYDQVTTQSLNLNHVEHPVLIAERKKAPNPKLTKKEQKERDDQLDDLLAFYRNSQAVINERDYIQEAIDKLNQTVSIRKFIGTIVDCQVDLKNVTNKNLFSFAIDDASWQKALDDNNLKLNYPTYFLGTTKTNATITATGMQPSLISDQGYSSNTVLKLSNKCKVISWETESIRTNMKNATQAIYENVSLINLNLNTNILNQWNSTIPDQLATLAELQNAQITHSLLIQAAIKFNNHIGNIQTKGHQLYITDPNWLGYDPNANRPDKDTNLYEHDLIAGYLIYLQILNGKNTYCLNEVSEYFGRYTKNPADKKTMLSIGTDGMVHTIVSPTDQAPQPDIQGLHTGYQFGWDGTRVNSENPMRHQERVYKNEDEKTLDLIADFTAQMKNIQIETLVLNLYSRRWVISETFPYSNKIPNPPPQFLLARSFLFKGLDVPNPRLKFTNDKVYRYAMVGQFHNGYYPSAVDELKDSNNYSEYVNFQRSDHIKSLIISLDQNIYMDGNHKVLKPDHLGESILDLVIRRGELVNNATCSRHILPPPIPNFFLYLWYDFKNGDPFTKSRRLSEMERLKWYKRSQKEDADGNLVDNDEKAHAIWKGGYDYLPDPVVTGFVVRFYYDQDCTLQMSGNHQEVFCPYSLDAYPDLPAWEIMLEEGRNNVDADPFTHKLHVPISPGQQFYAAIFPTFDKDFACFADAYLSGPGFQGKTLKGKGYFDLLKCGITTLSFTYALQRPLFEPEITGVSITKYKNGTANKQPSTVNLCLDINFEHLNIWNGITLPNVQPTGEMDIFMLWDDYTNHSFGIQKSIGQKINAKADDDGYIYVGKVDFNQCDNKGSLYHSTLKRKQNFPKGSEDAAAYGGTLCIEVDHTFNINYFTDAVFRVKNVTKYSRYFIDTPIDKLSESNKEDFSRWSDKYSEQMANKQYEAITYSYVDQVTAKSNYLFNNSKPDSPKIDKIIPLNIKDEYEKKKTVYYQRIRIYFNQVPLIGKQSRIALLVSDPASVYQKYLKGSIGNAGIDAVTDDLSDRLNLNNDLLTLSNFVYDDKILDSDYKNTFIPALDPPSQSGVIDKIGLVSYVTQFDREQSLWYIDTQMKLNNKKGEEFHNPFIQLYLTAYQPYSANYANQPGINTDSSDGFSLDYRISLPIKAEFFSIYPTRTFENPLVLFKNHPKAYCTLSGFTKSLFFKQADKSLHTEFVVSVQRKGIHDIWTTIEIESMDSKLRIDKVEKQKVMTVNSKYYQPLLYPYSGLLQNGSNFECDFQVKFSKSIFEKYRVVIHEVDCFNGLDQKTLSDILSNTKADQIERTAPTNIGGVNLRSTYIFEH